MSEPLELIPPDPKPLVVTVPVPSFPLVLASPSWLKTLAEAEKEEASLRVTDAATAQLAAHLQQRLTSAGRNLDNTRSELKRPFLDINRKIEDAAKVPAERIEVLKRNLNAKLVAFKLDQEKLAQETEKKRQEELAKLEAQKRTEEEAEQKRQQELAKKMPPVAEDMEFDAPDMPVEKTEIEKKIEEVKFAPTLPKSKPTGVAYRTSLVIESADVAKLPDAFVKKEANLAAIRAMFCASWKEGSPMPACPGVIFKIDRQAVSTGRSNW